MASVRSTIDLVITGATRGLGAAAAEARAMAERVADAEDRVSDARRRQAEANSRVAETEARLNAARQRAAAATARFADAESRTTVARTRSQISTAQLQRAEDDLNRARASGTATAQQLADADTRVQQARAKAQNDARILAQAEQQLANARRQQGSSSAAVTALEERLARARGQQFAASERLAREEERLRIIRNRGTDDINRQRDGILGVFDAFSRLAGAFTGADGASTSLLAKLAAINNVVTTIGGPIIQAAVGLAQVVALTAAWVEIVGVLGGLVGQALGGIPALLFAVGAAGLTAVLAFDGFGAAVEGTGKKMDAALAKLAPNAREAALVFRNELKPAVRELQQAVQNTFFEGMAKEFQKIAAAVPQLIPGFQAIAAALRDMAKGLIDFATSAQGITTINSILNGTAALMRALGPGITAFVKGLLDAANIGAPAFQRLGEAIAAVLAQLGGVFSKLADSGVIQQAVLGLASTIQGLGNVLGPVIELLIRMGAALGTSLGGSLTDLGNIIQSTIPFFTKLADVAGKILLDAFEQLKGPIIELVNSVFPGFSSGLDGLQSLMHNTVLPAIAGFINFLRTDGIPGIIAFTQGMIINFTAAGSAILGFVSGALTGLQQVLKFAAVLTGNQAFLEMAGQIEVAKTKIDGLKTSLDGIHDKTVNARANVQGADAVKGLANAIFSVTGKTVNTISNVFGKPENEALTGAIDKVLSKIVSTTSNVPGGPLLGTEGNNALTGAIGGVNNKTVTTTGNVPGGPTLGTQGNQALRSAIDNVIDKTVTVTANVTGTSAVLGLVNAISGVVNKTVSVVVNTIQNTLTRAGGGPTPGGVPVLVGEQGPELIVLPKGGGFVYTAAQTRAILGSRGSGTLAGGSTGAAPDPVTVTVNLSQEAIAGIAEVVITRRDRQTKRTVFAGSGVTV